MSSEEKTLYYAPQELEFWGVEPPKEDLMPYNILVSLLQGHYEFAMPDQYGRLRVYDFTKYSTNEQFKNFISNIKNGVDSYWDALDILNNIIEDIKRGEEFPCCLRMRATDILKIMSPYEGRVFRSKIEFINNSILNALTFGLTGLHYTDPFGRFVHLPIAEYYSIPGMIDALADYMSSVVTLGYERSSDTHEVILDLIKSHHGTV